MNRLESVSEVFVAGKLEGGEKERRQINKVVDGHKETKYHSSETLRQVKVSKQKRYRTHKHLHSCRESLQGASPPGQL